MTTIKIDDKEYEIDELPDLAKQQIVSLQYVNNELAKLNLQIAALQTAKIAYEQSDEGCPWRDADDEDFEIVGDSLSLVKSHSQFKASLLLPP